MGISYQKKLESLEKKKAVHTSRKHGVRTICNFIPKEDRPENSRDVNLLETIWIIDYRRRDNIQRSSFQNTCRTKTVTTPRLEMCDFRHALGALTFYTSTLKKFQKT